MKDSKSYYNTPSWLPFSNLEQEMQMTKQPRQGLPFGNHARETQCGVGIKRIILVVMMLLSASIVFAQKQNGVVKTPGRMVNGKLVPGTLLQGATVQVEGRQAVVAKNGKFSFPVKDGKYTLKSVSKQGYRLVDAEACRQYSYSANPLQIVMEEPDKLQSDQLAKERKLRRELQRRIQQREDEIDALNVSVEEKNKLLVQLNKQRDENENIIKDMAAYYATLDYDQLDAFQQRVSALLEECQLERADSLLRTRGDIAYRVRQIRTEQEAIAREQAALAKRKKSLEESKAGTQRKLEAIAADCYNFYQRFFMAHQNDSAAYYLELRASLDTTNVEWQRETGNFIKDYLADYDKAILYYDKALRQSTINKEGNYSVIAELIDNKGVAYFEKGEIDSAMAYCQRAFKIRKEIYGDDHLEISKSYNCLAQEYKIRGEYNIALEYMLKAIKIRENFLGESNPETAILYNNIGQLYKERGDFAKALAYNMKALEINEKYYGKDHPMVATSYNNVGIAYDNLDSLDKALINYNISLSIREKIYGERHPSVATSYNNIGYYWLKRGDLDKALENSLKSIDIREKVYGNVHPRLATSYSNVSAIYYKKQDYDKSLEYCQKSLVIQKKLYGEEHPDIADSYNTIAVLYKVKKDFQSAIYYLEKSLDIREKKLGIEHPKVATTYYNIAITYELSGDLSKAKEYVQKCINIREKKLGSDHKSTKLAYEELEQINQKLAEQESTKNVKNKQQKNNKK